MATPVMRARKEVKKPNMAAASLANLEAGKWKPGQSGNPGGRAPGLEKLVRAKTHDGLDTVSFFVGVANNRKMKMEHRIEAHKWLADRGFGRAMQPTELTGKDGGPLLWGNAVLSDFTVDELRQLLTLAERNQAQDEVARGVPKT